MCNEIFTNYGKYSKKESAQYGLGNLTLEDYVCLFISKLSEKPIIDPYTRYKTM